METTLPATTTAVVSIEPVYDTPLAFKESLEAQRKFLNHLEPGVDYGNPIGEGLARSGMQALKDAGAYKLMRLYGLTARYVLEKEIERWPMPEDPIGFFHYAWRCDLYTIGSEVYVGCGHGSCNSMETRYRYRTGERVCPECEQPAIRRSKYPDRETGERGWYCYDKAGGCGEQFDAQDARIVEQDIGKVVNTEIAGLQNTINLTSQKRARVRAVRSISGQTGFASVKPPAREEADQEYKLRERRPAPSQDSSAEPAPVDPNEAMCTEEERVHIRSALGQGRKTQKALIEWLQANGVEDGSKIPVRLKDDLIAWAKKSA